MLKGMPLRYELKNLDFFADAVSFDIDIPDVQLMAPHWPAGGAGGAGKQVTLLATCHGYKRRSVLILMAS
ncbi:hypothetical protein EVAR_8521_1 [Eumeta japonica]|uniref:Uncharacterized protein n=1 Tax=Eumeta variegata TaxID=151549 RepID=A0A4C1TYM8_EUMVA|nr:hypothetical protein EVAR_8521_1 [Eumeta japonica]